MNSITEEAKKLIDARLASGELTVKVEGQFPNMFLLLTDTQVGEEVYAPELQCEKEAYVWTYKNTLGEDVTEPLEAETRTDITELCEYIFEKSGANEKLAESVEAFRNAVEDEDEICVNENAFMVPEFDASCGELHLTLKGAYDLEEEEEAICDGIERLKRSLDIEAVAHFDIGRKETVTDSETGEAQEWWVFTAQILHA